MNAIAKREMLQEHVTKVNELQKTISFFKDQINRRIKDRQRGISGSGLKSLTIDKAIDNLTKLDERLQAALKTAETGDFEQYDKLANWVEANQRQLAALKKSQRKLVNVYEFSYELLDAIKDRVTILDMTEELNIRKRRSGAEKYVILCPFHDEKTPSCMVYVNEDKYHCFGCQSSGDVVDFYQNYLGIEFDEAITRLCDRLSIQVMDADKVEQADGMINQYKSALALTEEELRKEKLQFKRRCNENNN